MKVKKCEFCKSSTLQGCWLMTVTLQSGIFVAQCKLLTDLQTGGSWCTSRVSVVCVIASYSLRSSGFESGQVQDIFCPAVSPRTAPGPT